MEGKQMKRILAGLLAASAIGIGFPAAAQHPQGHGGHDRGERMMRGLDLSEAQRDQIFKIRHEQAPAARERMKSARAAQQALRKAASDPNASGAQIRQLADAVGKTHADAAVARVETQRKVLAVLTPDQRSKLEQMRQQRSQHRGRA
jgi:periplasmic protein CpxP/Spy